MNSIKNILQNLPHSPGIYQFFNEAGEIIYIGKSVNLKSRVNSYFNGKSKLNFAKKLMVEQIVDIQTIVTNNETESLILEHTLVKDKKPKFNVLLKDDKNYYYIKVTAEKFPKIIKTRIKSKGGTYFGPYTYGPYVVNILRLAKKIFGYGCYGINFFRQGNEYNLDKYIFQNHTDSEGKILSEIEIQEFYKTKIDDIKVFLRGDIREVIQVLESKMKEYAKNLKFEEAAKIKYDIQSLQVMQEHQIVRDFVSGDFDVVHILEKYERYYIGCIEIRDSKITGFFNYEIENHLEETSEELMKNFVEQRFAEKVSSSVTFGLDPEVQGTKLLLTTGLSGQARQGHSHKITFILPFSLEGISSEIQIEVPKIGGKLDVLKLCYKNIYEYAHKKHLASLSTKGFTKKTMQSLLEILGYDALNKDILFECNDISHLSGTHTVASRSIVENGKKNTSKYKKFNIKDLEEGKIDDFASMKEIMERRLRELVKLRNIPDLIVIDGGKGQLGAVIKIVEDFKKGLFPVIPANAGIFQQEKTGAPNNRFLHSQEGHNLELQEKLQLLDSLQIVSIAKREEELFLPIHQTHPNLLLQREGDKETEHITTPSLVHGACRSEKGAGGEGGMMDNKFKRILLSKDSDELRLIQSLRDEAHRFAITFNRDKRISSMKKNILESIPGIGPVTRKKILKEYGNVEQLKNHKKEELIEFLGATVVENLENHGLV